MYCKIAIGIGSKTAIIEPTTGIKFNIKVNVTPGIIKIPDPDSPGATKDVLPRTNYSKNFRLITFVLLWFQLFFNI